MQMQIKYMKCENQKYNMPASTIRVQCFKNGIIILILMQILSCLQFSLTTNKFSFNLAIAKMILNINYNFHFISAIFIIFYTVVDKIEGNIILIKPMTIIFIIVIRLALKFSRKFFILTYFRKQCIQAPF